MGVDVEGQKKEEKKLKKIEAEQQLQRKSEIALKQQCNFDLNLMNVRFGLKFSIFQLRVAN